MAVERPAGGGQWKPTPAPPAPKPPASTGGGSSPQGQQPLAAAGAGGGVSKYVWATALVQALGGVSTPQIINLIIAWINSEGTKANWNPLAITKKAPGSTDFNTNNGYPVQNFTSFSQGVALTAEFIQNGRYPNILAAIRSGNPDLALAHPQEFDTWGSGGAHVTSLYRTVSGDPNAGQGALLAAGGSGGPTTAGVPANVQSILSADPSLEWALGVPEVAQILTQAAAGNWDDAKLKAALLGSDYYRSHSEAARRWTDLASNNPGEAQRQLQQTEADLRALATSLGLNLSDAALAGLALGAHMFGWDDVETRQHLIGAAAFSQSGALGQGAIGNGAIQAKQLFAQYGIDLPDSQAQQFGLQINTASDPTSALENLRPIAIGQAKGMFPGLADQLDQGVTVAQVFTPYANAAANLLEIDPSQIDLTDPKWNRALQGDQKQGQMSLQQWQSTVMGDPRYAWDKTMNARDAAVGLVKNLGQTFGVSS